MAKAASEGFKSSLKDGYKTPMATGMRIEL